MATRFRNFLRAFGQFIQAFWVRWWVAMSCLLGIPFTFVGISGFGTEGVARFIVFLMGVGGLIFSSFWVWNVEHEARLKAEGKIDALECASKRSGRFWNLEGHATVLSHVLGPLVESQIDKDTYKLYLNLTALKTVSLSRITVLFNRSGGNGSYQLAAYESPHQMLCGEELDLVLMHYRSNNNGTYWGDLDRATESRSLDTLNKEERDRHVACAMHIDGPYYCQLVVQHTQGEERLNFTVFVPSDGERPCVFTNADHKDYDPNRFIPASGTFLS